MKTGDKITCYCNRCKRQTNHTVLAVHNRNCEINIIEGVCDEYVLYYSVAQCDGCNLIMFAESDYDGYDVEDISTLQRNGCFPFKVYPGQTGLSINDDYEKFLPKDLFAIYSEVIHCIEYHCNILATIGLRSLLEGICKDQNVVSGHKDLWQLIDILEENKLITRLDKEWLDTIRLNGNKSVHELQRLSESELLNFKDIIDHIINSFYVFKNRNIVKL